MSVQIGAKPDSGFDDPIGMLIDCHRRIVHFVNILWYVVDRAVNRALTNEEKSVIETSLEYFRTGGARHNQDEEDSLFPRLGNRAGEESVVELSELKHDHQIAAGLHKEVERLYRKWIASGSLDMLDWQDLSGATQRLKDLYIAHIKVEEEVVFPRAANTLDAATIRAIGDEFLNRRK